MGLALPKVFDNSPDKIEQNRKMHSGIDHGEAANDDHYGHKKKHSGSKLLKKGLKFVFKAAVVGLALTVPAMAFADLAMIDMVHYPNEEMQTIKNMIKASPIQSYFEWMGFVGNDGILQDIFNSELISPLVESFRPDSAADVVNNLAQNQVAAAGGGALLVGEEALDAAASIGEKATETAAESFDDSGFDDFTNE